MKRIITTIAVVLAALAVLGGCTKKSGDEIKLVHWTMWNEAEPQGQIISQAAEAFTKETGIKVEVNFNGRDIRKTLQPALDAGEVIDIFDEDIDRVNGSWGNYLLPLDSYITKTYSTTNGKPYNEVINQGLLILVKERGNGSVKTIPFQPFIFLTMYNKDLFDKAGITVLPKDWQGMLDACAKLKANGVAGITVDDAYMAALFGYCMVRIAGWNATRAMADNNDFSSPAVLEFGRIWENMARNGYIHPNAAGNVWPSGQINDFATGKAAMYLNGSWLPNEIKGNAPNMRWGSFAWPAMGNGDGVYANNYSAQCFAVNKNSKHPEEAFRFIVYLTTGKWDDELARESLSIPIANASKWPDDLAEAKVVMENTTMPLPWAAGMEDRTEVNAKIKDSFSKLIKGDYNAQQFADAMRK